MRCNYSLSLATACLPACLPACPAVYKSSCAWPVSSACLDNKLVRPHGQGLAYSIAGRRDLMSPSLPEWQLMLVVRHTAALCALSDRPTSLPQQWLLQLWLWLWALSASAHAGQGRWTAEGERDEEARIPLNYTCSSQIPWSVGRLLCVIQSGPSPQRHAIARRSNSRTKPLLCSDVMLPRPGMQGLHEWWPTCRRPCVPVWH